MITFGSASSHEPFQAASLPREEGGAACSSSAAVDWVLRGPLDVIEAREEMDRRLTVLVEAIAAYMGWVD